MTSSAPRPPVSKELRQYFDWVESRIKSGDIVAGQLEQRVGAAQQQSTIIGGLASNNSAQQAVIDDRTVSQSDTNRLARPLVEEAFWNSAIAGTRTIFTAGDGELSVARNVSWSNGSLVFQPNTEESAEIHVTNILAAPESRKIYVEALYTTGLEPEIWVEQRDIDGNQVEGIAPIVVTGKGTVTLSATGGIVSYSVRLVRPVNAGIAAVGNVKVFEVIGTGGMNISPEGIVVENPAGDKTLEINPELAILAAPTKPTLGSSMGTVAVHWDGLLASGPTPAHFGYVYAEESVDGVNNWVRAGQPLNKSGDILVRPPVGETRFYRLTAVDTSNRSSAPSASHSIVVGGVLIPDLDSEIIDAIDDALFQAGEAGEAAAAAQQTADDAEAAAAQAALDATNKSAAAETAAKAYADAEAAAAQAAAEAAASDDATTKANAAQAAAEAAAAADALQKANAARDAAIAVADAAQDTADDAAADAEAAKEEARAAQTTADGKNRIYTQVESPGDNKFPLGTFETTSGTVEVRRNLLTNPSFAVPATEGALVPGWNVITRQGGIAKNSGTSSYSDNVLAPTGTPFALSITLMSTSGTQNITVYLRETLNGSFGTQPMAASVAVSLVQGVPTRVSLAGAISGATSNGLRVWVPTTAVGVVQFISAVLERDTLTNRPFFDGSTRPKVRQNLNTNPKVQGSSTGWSLDPTGASVATGVQFDFPTEAPRGRNLIYQAGAIPGELGAERSSSVEVEVPMGFPAVELQLFTHDYSAPSTHMGSSENIVVQPGTVVTILAPSFRGTNGTNGVRTILRTGASMNNPAGSRFIVRNLLVEDARIPGPYFDGSTTGIKGYTAAWSGAVGASTSYLNDVDTAVSWVGPVNASESILTGLGVAGTSGNAYSGGTGWSSSHWSSSGSSSLRIAANKAGSAGNAAVPALTTTVFEGGKTYTIFAKVRLDAPLTGTNESYSRRMRIVGANTGNPVSPQPPNVAGVHDITWTFTMPVGVTTGTVQLWHGGMPGSPDIWWDDLVIFDGAVEKPLAQGDLWYVLDPANPSRVSGVKSWDGATWRDYQIVADSVIVPGSIDGGTLIKDGTVTSNKVLMDEGFADKFWANEANFGQVSVDMLTPNVGNVIDISINPAIGDMQSDLEEQRRYYRFDDEGLKIGDPATNEELRLNPGRIEMVQAGNVPTYWEAQTFYVERMIVEAANIGAHRFEKYATGRTIIRPL